MLSRIVSTIHGRPEDSLTRTDRFSKLIVNGIAETKEWITIRQTKNYQSNSGVTSVTSPDMRCYQNRAGTSTATVAAGTDLGFIAESQITHFGPVQFYMARVPNTADINTWEPSGNVWFKAASISAQGSPLTSGVQTWPAYGIFSHIALQFPALLATLSSQCTYPNTNQRRPVYPSPFPKARLLASILSG
jgi:hypothetical protein